MQNTIVRNSTNMQILLILSHPDYNRRPQIHTGSADLYHKMVKRSRASCVMHVYRRWGLSPRPEIYAINITPIIQVRNDDNQNWRMTHTFSQKT